MKLVIVESPSKAKTIQKYLGENYRVLASGGHVCDLPEKSLGIDVKNNFKPEYVVNTKSKETIKRLKQAVKDSEEVYLATDPDREGEAISWHLSNVLDIDGNKHRIEFHEISPKAVNSAIKNARDINISLVDAQQARRILDRLVGYKVSPILNKKIKSGLSGGRVQSAALKMIVDKEREINAFVTEEYWNIFAMLNKTNNKLVLKSQLVDYNGKKIKVTDDSQTKQILQELEGANYSVDKVKKGVSKSHPSAPFSTSTLQQDGSQKLGLTAPQVMQLAQQLYEGLEIDGLGHTALVTYIRTDSVRISEDMQKETAEFIKEKFGEEFAPKKFNVYLSKNSGNVQDAHEAIRPISLSLTPDSIKEKVAKNCYRLYKLIYDRYIASQMTDAIYNTLNVKIKASTIANEEFGFKITGRAIDFKGYTVAYESANVEEEEETNSDTIPNLVEGEKLTLKEIKSEQKFTKPPSRYNDATLVKAMEENGIGRPSTYATVISVLAKREYTVKEQKNIKPTQLGETVVSFMEEYFSNIVNASFTAGMEDKLDEVEKGKVWQDVLSEFYPSFQNDINNAISQSKKMSVPEQVTEVVCDKCGALMVIKEGKFGKFLACPNYPTCKNIKNYVEPVGVCPICKGDISQRRSKTGKVFFGCSNYPTCTFMSWDLPAPILCPECNATMKIVTSGDKKKYICTQYKCKHTILLEETETAETDAKS